MRLKSLAHIPPASVTFDRDHLRIAKEYGGIPILIQKGRRLSLAIRMPNGDILHDFRKEITALTQALADKMSYDKRNQNARTYPARNRGNQQRTQ